MERRGHKDGSRSMTAFIEHALDLYLDYLSAQDVGLFLPAAIRSCINGRLGTTENRMASLMFKLTVGLDTLLPNSTEESVHAALHPLHKQYSHGSYWPASAPVRQFVPIRWHLYTLHQ